MRHHAWMFVSLGFTVVGAVAMVSTVQRQSVTERFRALLDEDWKYWMSEYPETATALGYPGQNSRWTDYAPNAIAARAAHLREALTQLNALDRRQLSSADQVSYDLYRDMMESAIEGLAFGNDAMPIRSVVVRNLRMPINQMEGVQHDIPRIISLMPAATVTDYEDIVARLKSASILVDQTISLMREGLKAGMTPPQVTFRDVPDQVKAHIVDKPLTSPLLEAFAKWPVSISTGERERLTKAAVAAYTDTVRPAFSRLHEFLTRTYVPACRSTIGVDALPQGGQLYAYNVRWHTTSTATPQDIHKIGLAEVTRIRGEMDAVIKSLGFTGTFDDFKEFLRTDRRFYYTRGEELLAGYRDIAKRADPELARLFRTLPRTPYGVQPIPDATAPSQTTAYYEPGALSAGRPGNMFANTYKLDARPKWEMEALTLHEAVPGHHLQIALAQEIEGLPEFRKNTSYTAYVEGWGLYAESLGEEMGFYQDPYPKFGQLTYEMWRAVRLVVDTGLHSMGWTRQQAIDFFAANAAKTMQDIVVEVDRYIVWPGQALGYKMGQLRIQELRREAERRLGSRFDIRAFHDILLSEGAVPLQILEKRVETFASQ